MSQVSLIVGTKREKPVTCFMGGGTIPGSAVKPNQCEPGSGIVRLHIGRGDELSFRLDQSIRRLERLSQFMPELYDIGPFLTGHGERFDGRWEIAKGLV